MPRVRPMIGNIPERVQDAAVRSRPVYSGKPEGPFTTTFGGVIQI
jgi:hypothetical protein